MSNPFPSWRERGLVFVRLSNSSVVALMRQMHKSCRDRRPLQTKFGHKNHYITKISLKPDRDQTEVFSTSSYNGYVTVCQQPTCSPICQRREGLRNSGKKLALIHYIRSRFLERNLCQALRKIIYAMIIISIHNHLCFFTFTDLFHYIFRKA